MSSLEENWTDRVLTRQPGRCCPSGDLFGDRVVSGLFARAEIICQTVVFRDTGQRRDWDRRLDDILTSPWSGYPVMILLLGGVLWVTVIGANYPSEMMAAGLFWLEGRLAEAFRWLGSPEWLTGVLVFGMYRSLSWVVSVMLPPMAIFFPCFTFLEELGYLPRVAFNLDRLLQKAGAHGKQALTMSMGLGCNAAGVIACRIIDSPRERLIAVLTNNFIPCNGRFPLLIALGTIFAGVTSPRNSILAAGVVMTMVLVGIITALAVSWLLSKTLIRGIPSYFTLELPPYRQPQIGRILLRSLVDRTLHVLARAVTIAAPAGAIIWVMANVRAGDYSLMGLLVKWLNPLAAELGMDGHILTAFLLGLPANEIVLPIMVMSYVSGGTMTEPGSLDALRTLLVEKGWTFRTALAVMLFSVLHYPCATTIATIFKETRHFLWTVLGVLLPFMVAVAVTFLVARIAL